MQRSQNLFVKLTGNVKIQFFVQHICAQFMQMDTLYTYKSIKEEQSNLYPTMKRNTKKTCNKTMQHIFYFCFRFYTI